MDGWMDGRTDRMDGRTDDAKTISLRLRRGIATLVEVHKVMLHTKYQGSKPYSFRQKIFSCFPYNAYVKHVNPRAGHYWLQGYNFNKLGRGSLGDASYQISKLYALWFQTRIYFMFLPI